MPKKTEKKQTETKARQPIVAVMGHVDHGKTTLLDSIRNTRVAAKEAGGITQNTRAHEVTTKSGFKITFIDTPGHAAFSAMRQRGARVTDFVLLVVAADDGIQPQTKQSIEFAKENNVPVIVAINKVDLAGVKIEKIRNELSQFGIVPEAYGGENLFFEVSALKKTGLDEMLEGIELLSEVSELKAHTPKEGVIADAFVMESQLDKQVGYTALAILKSGNLDNRYVGVTKDSIFKVRAYLNEENRGINSVNESQPFVITGLRDDLPTGEIINFVKDEQTAKELQIKLKSGEVVEEEPAPAAEMSVEDLFAKLLVAKKEEQSGLQQKSLNIVLRTSSQGTLEAVKTELAKLESDQSKVNILNSGTGPVSEDDLNRAKLAKGLVIAFQTEVPRTIGEIAKRNKVLVRNYEIIYELVDEIAEVLDSMDSPLEEEVEVGRAKVKQIFTLSDGSQVAGCQIMDGRFMRGYSVKVERLDEKNEATELGRAKIKEVRQSKEVVKEVKKGQECGLMLDPKIDDLQEGDQIVAFRVEKY
jgi:translation initiation factor IF-2